MKILVLNCGGSSMKFQLFDMQDETVLIKGGVDRLGTDKAEFSYVSIKGTKQKYPTPIKEFSQAIQMVIEIAVSEGVISSVNDISAFSHKMAHGGEALRKAVLVDDSVIAAIRDCFIMAPVHNPPSLKGIEELRSKYPNTPQIVSFETAFHTTVPDYAYFYGVPYEWYESYKVRKYGFHGASHSYVSAKAAEMLGRPLSELKIVSCHLGSGTSVCAIKGGKSIDISSGLTPQSGTIMSTRPGDFDPWVIPLIMDSAKMGVSEVSSKLIKEGGLLGISGVSGDMRELEEAAAQGNDRARLAIDVFCYHVKKYIGAFSAVMNGIDVLIFTGGIGEHGPAIRKSIVENLDYLGMEIDESRNLNTLKEGEISSICSKVRILVIATNEEIMVARQAKAILDGI